MSCSVWATSRVYISMPSVSGQKAYEEIFEGNLNASNVEALDALFMDAGKGSSRQRRRRRKGTS